MLIRLSRFLAQAKVMEPSWPIAGPAAPGTQPACQLLALNVTAGTARLRQLSEAMRKTYARREFFSP